MAQVIIVSNRLPISVKKENAKLVFSPSLGGIATGLSSFVNDPGNTWIGWPGIASDELSEKDKQEIATVLATHNCHPVFLSQKQILAQYPQPITGIAYFYQKKRSIISKMVIVILFFGRFFTTLYPHV